MLKCLAKYPTDFYKISPTEERSLIFVEFELHYTVLYCVSIVTRTNRLETRDVSIEIFIYVKIYRAAQHTGDDFEKNIAFPEGNKQFAGDFVRIWMKQKLIWFNLQIDGTRNGLSNIKETFAGNLQLQMSVLRQSISIFQGWCLKFI